MDKKALVGLVLAVVLGGAAIAFIVTRPKKIDTHDGGVHMHSQAPPQEDKETVDATQQASVDIIYTNEGFSPRSLKIAQGTAIRVHNSSSYDLGFSLADHQAYAKHPELNMDTLKPGEEKATTPHVTGSYGYHNHLRPQDMGAIFIK